MENYSIVIFILAIVIGLSSFADKIKIPYPVLLVSAGIAIGFIPGIPQIELDPDIVFLIFLPPMLFNGGFNISFKDFKIHLNTIVTLSMALVFITTISLAAVAHYLIPGMTWPLSFVLGAILSATDAVAAMSITQGLGLPHKITTILEGESLINDASGLISLRFAMAAAFGSSFILWKAGLEFLFLIIGGFLVGIVLGKLLGMILKRVHKNSMVAISFTLLMPFVAYLLAEEIHVSGVIAVVVLAMNTSLYTKVIFPDRTKEQSKSIWEIIVFLLNGLIFVLIGLEFPHVLRNIDNNAILPLIGYSLLICVVALLVRMIRVLFHRNSLQRIFFKQTLFPRRRNKMHEDALLDWKSAFIIGWSGIRGIVSLAAALAIPLTLADGSPFPHRNTIIFISVVVVLITIIFQGLSLPLLVKLLNRHNKPAQ